LEIHGIEAQAHNAIVQIGIELRDQAELLRD
jgi:hypothetical protein